jgi:hypothetical protein
MLIVLGLLHRVFVGGVVDAASIFSDNPEDRGSRFLRNVDNNAQNQTV